MRVAISSGHGMKIQGAIGPKPWGLNEVNEARRVVEKVADFLRAWKVGVAVFHDDTSTSQSANLNAIVNWHNSQERDLDVSVHFNAYTPTEGERGTECLYLTQYELADQLANAMAEAADFINRGDKKRTDLAFLNGTEMPAVLIETCFVDAHGDVKKYHAHFDPLCEAIADTIANGERPVA